MSSLTLRLSPVVIASSKSKVYLFDKFVKSIYSFVLKYFSTFCTCFVVKINYVTQVSVAPPKFVFFSNNPELVHFSYKRYIEKKFREYFGFEGCPIEIVINKKSENKYK